MLPVVVTTPIVVLAVAGLLITNTISNTINNPFDHVEYIHPGVPGVVVDYVNDGDYEIEVTDQVVEGEAVVVSTNEDGEITGIAIFRKDGTPVDWYYKDWYKDSFEDFVSKLPEPYQKFIKDFLDGAYGKLRHHKGEDVEWTIKKDPGKPEPRWHKE